MKRRSLLQALAVSAGGILFPFSFASADDKVGTAYCVGIEEGPDGLRAVFSVSGDLGTRGFKLDKPDRVVLDFTGARLVLSGGLAGFSSVFVKRVRLGELDDNGSRLVFDLRQPVQLETSDGVGTLGGREWVVVMRPLDGQKLQGTEKRSEPEGGVDGGAAAGGSRKPEVGFSGNDQRVALAVREFGGDGDGFQVIFSADGGIRHKAYVLRSPNRGVVDFYEAGLVDVEKLKGFRNEFIKGVRVGHPVANGTRVVFDLNALGDMEANLAKGSEGEENWQLVVRLVRGGKDRTGAGQDVAVDAPAPQGGAISPVNEKVTASTSPVVSADTQASSSKVDEPLVSPAPATAGNSVGVSPVVEAPSVPPISEVPEGSATASLKVEAPSSSPDASSVGRLAADFPKGGESSVLSAPAPADGVSGLPSKEKPSAVAPLGQEGSGRSANLSKKGSRRPRGGALRPGIHREGEQATVDIGKGDGVAERRGDQEVVLGRATEPVAPSDPQTSTGEKGQESKVFDRSGQQDQEPKAEPIPYGQLENITPKKRPNLFFSLRENGNIGRGDSTTVIMVDPGHGGIDPGAIGHRGTREKDVTLAVAMRLRQRLDGVHNCKVVLTRYDDRFLTLRNRIALARSARADLFLSLHADAYRDSSIHGASVFCLTDGVRITVDEKDQQLAHRENSSDGLHTVSSVGGEHESLLELLQMDAMRRMAIEDSVRFGNRLIQSLGSQAGVSIHYPRVKRVNFLVLKNPGIPSSLVEMAFLSNRHDERRMVDSGYQEAIAQALASGISGFFRLPQTNQA